MTWKSKQLKGVQLNGKSGRMKLKNNFEGNENWWVKYDVFNQIISKVFKRYTDSLLFVAWYQFTWYFFGGKKVAHLVVR